MFQLLLNTDSDWALTAARIALGVVLFAHGAQKAFGWFGGHGLRNTLGFFKSQLKIPAPLALLAVGTELFGGLALIVGLLSRVAALGIAGIMLVAVVKVHGRFGLFMNWFGDRAGHGFEYHLLAIALCAVIVVQGGGAYSIDRALAIFTHGINPAQLSLGR